MSNRKTYKIIKIIDEYNVVVNAGSSQSIKINDTLEIFIKGEPIIDLDTDVELGTLDTVKARLRVKQVFENFCVCSNYENSKSNLSVLIDVQGLYGSSEPKRLNVDSSQISGGFKKNEDSKIRIGDLVRKSL